MKTLKGNGKRYIFEERKQRKDGLGWWWADEALKLTPFTTCSRFF